MNIQQAQRIAKATGDRPVAVALQIRRWTREPMTGQLAPPILIESYIAATLAIRIPLPEGKNGAE